MLFVKNLSVEEYLTLKNMQWYHPSHIARMRAHAVLLSNVGFRLKDLSDIFGVCRQTTSTWLTAWEKRGIAALLDKPRSGRPRKLTGEAKHYVLD
ncbi:helix-turn-helix domain-containing protein [Methylicorpusculum sp.]|uniref:helix-turn-helix domain-containing protein n=1 Tax=Methylicorpusculum sp. TaxID=2713644 RepID=UPI002ABB7EE1|nr:helix-turn-helix domain-containing protein [Methylicorpusculum sp.]MDZ4149561.1 helix-turn-helix domain-containing protein [Methylicorpusculum sp.]